MLYKVYRKGQMNMAYGLNSSFKRQLNNKIKNKRLLAVIVLVLIIMFSIVLTEREGGATPKEVVKRWMKTVKNNEFKKCLIISTMTITEIKMNQLKNSRKYPKKKNISWIC